MRTSTWEYKNDLTVSDTVDWQSGQLDELKGLTDSLALLE